MSLYGRHEKVLFQIEKAQVKFDLMSTGLHKLWENAIPAIPDHYLYDSKHPICEPETQNTLCYGIFMDYYERSEKNIKNALGEEILARQLKIAERQAIFVGLN